MRDKVEEAQGCFWNALAEALAIALGLGIIILIAIWSVSG